MRKLLFLFFLLSFFGCRSYRQNIMLQTESERLPKGLVQAAAGIEKLEKNYLIQKSDLLEIKLYSNKGESLIDVNIPKPGAVAGTATTAATTTIPNFLVESDGMVRLPQVGAIKLEGYTIRQADSLLSVAYNNYYVDPFVNVKFANKRVIVLGATRNAVVPLTNENINLLEVLALSGGINENAKAGNIRLIRGDLKDPEVHLINLSTIEGMTKANLIVQPNDIIYIEPVKRPLREIASDIAPILSIIGSVVSLISIVLVLRNQNR
ncbi:polysaccharide biosynthesis/export family protein [Xanthocytophaga flava]|nr:polysaccharide biosynthesis/export family protein [Xanthocytophaga flavus]MDJ1468443.1 polysaccharide biosynthesis/export family protein [Xanthocytophaga flavus]